MLLALAGVKAQVIISSTGGGGFETGATFALNGWTTANDGQNQWYCGTTALCSGTRAAYIDNNVGAGSTNVYTMNSARVSHFYRNVTFPAGQTCITLSFDYKGQGESGFDFLKVYLVSTATTPVGGTQLAAGSLIGGPYNLVGTCTNATITIPASAAGTTQRLVFSWRNDNSGGANPAMMVDNISLVAAGGPANDDPCSATAVTPSATCSYTTYTNACASASAGPPAPGCANYLGGDVWFTTTVPASGSLILDTQTGVVTDGGMAVYTGTCGSLTLLSCDDDGSSNGLMPYLAVTCQTPGTQIWIRIWEYGNDNNGTFGLCVQDPGGTSGPPANDDPCNAVTLAVSGSCSYATYSNACANNSAGPPAPGCAGYLGGDVWFKVTVPTSGSLNIDTQTGIIQDGGMAVYSGTCGSLTLVACDDDNSANGAMPMITLTSQTPGATLWIRVWENGNDNNGTFGICVTDPCPGGSPVNDLPCNALALALGVSQTGNNSCSGSTGEPAAPICWINGASQLNTIWYSAVCPASGKLSIRTGLGTLINTQIAVYSGTCGPGLTLVTGGCNDDVTLCGNTQQWSEVVLTGLTVGATYYIAVDGYQGLTGDFSITAIDGNSAWPYIYGQDCGASFPVCSSTMTVGNPGFIGSGNYCDYPGNVTGCPGGSCIFVGERNSIWYSFTTNAAGTLGFTLTPNSPCDYDWALYDVTGNAAACSQISTNAILPIRCSYWGGTSATGMGAPGTETCDGTAGTLDGFSSTVAAAAGNQYLLLVSNFSTSTFVGYNLNWNTSPINYTASSTLVWTGAVNTDWTNSNNWGGCGTPDCSKDVVIFSGPTNQPVIPTGVTVNCRSITIQPSASVTMNGTATMNVCGDFVNNGTFTAATTSTVNFQGTVLQNITGSTTGANRFGNLTVTKTTGSVILNQNTDVGGALTISNGTSIFNINGKYLKVGGNFSNNNGSTTITGAAGSTVEFNGTGAQTYNQGASTLTLNNVTMNHTGTGVALFTHMVIGTSGTLTLTLGKIITNAFEVQVTNTAVGSCTVGNTNSFVQGNLRRYLSGAAGSYNFPVGHSVKGYQRANINFTTATTIPQLLAYFTAWGAVPTGPAASECVTATYNTLPALDNGYWTITASANPTSGNYDVTLYNTNYTNSTGAGWTVMKAATGAGPWGLNGTCVVTSTAATTQRTGLNGFSAFATAQSQIPLPMQLLSFTGESMGDYNRLYWTTATETNNDYFVLERSTNGQPFEDIAMIDGAGNSLHNIDYHYDDLHPAEGPNYYRLRQVDFNGESMHTAAILVDRKPATQPSVENVHPNPTTGDIFFEYVAPEQSDIHIVITDMFGRVVRDEHRSVETGRSQLKTTLESMSVGVYSLSISNESTGYHSVTRIVKQ